MASDPEQPILFVHGIKGGHLVDESGRRWVGAKQALNLDRRPLASKLTWTDGSQDRDGMAPDGPIERVLWVSIYRPFLGRMRRDFPNFESLSYDWRRALPESAAVLERALESMTERHGRRPLLIAHSMGGLVSHLVLRERPDLVRGVLFAGTPFGTGIGFARDTHLGAKTGLNAKLLNPEAVNSWASHWVFFPHDDDPGLRRGTTTIEHDWYEVAAWKAQRLGAFAPGFVGDVAAYERHLAQALPLARETRRKLEDPKHLAEARLPVAILRSGDHDTPNTVVENGPKAFRGWDVDSVEFVPGDSRVKKHSTEPNGIDFELFETDKVHDALLDDATQVGAALDFLRANAH